MKTIIALVVMMTAIQVQARTPIRYVEADVQVNHIDDQSPLAVYDIRHAHVRYDAFENTLTLKVQPDMPPCPAGLACAAVMPEPVVIIMDNVRTLQDRCGMITYTGIIDDTPHDGLQETLKLVDNTYNVCMGTIALPKYQVTYETFNPWTMNTSRAFFSSMEPDYHSMEDVSLPVQPLEAM